MSASTENSESSEDVVYFVARAHITQMFGWSRGDTNKNRHILRPHIEIPKLPHILTQEFIVGRVFKKIDERG